MPTVRNWARNQACVPVSVEHPASTDEVAAIVRRAHADGRRVKVIGAGHSFTATAMTNGVLLDLDRMRRVVSVDVEQQRVTVQAGITLRALGDELAAVGMAMPNLGDINVQSVAGAINTATHGTGLELGNLATTIVGLELVDGRGDVVRCDETREPELLRVARVGVGALGVVTEVTIQCVPAFHLHAHETIEILDEILTDVDADGVPAFARSAEHAEFFWMPGARRCQVKRNRRTDEPARPPSRVAYVRDKYVAENAAFGLVCRVGRRFPALAPKIAKAVAGAAGERDLIDRSDRVFASPRHVRFVEMEYGIPVEALPEAVGRVRDLTATLSFPSLFPIEVRVSAADDIALSTGYGRTSGWIAVHQYRGAPFESYFQGVETIMDDYDGRPHWGKLHFQSAATLRDRYPEWDAFAAARARLDPDGTFRNDYLDHVLGPVVGG
ncbi:MAG: D-arabinono-1,4-lactone oxidase [Ilumatobacter sp.]|uniref:D-arabinono-1,4-lactone oxidase n=1 Tax=Ilumatobacter sp. TaxID=1967498 RepID=UPI002602BE8F|nr:D-arabinono-1,4-lactone oxidase [Ilumatobacter sp.]MDJ0771433.1 D-arabinono-1,4-lactone oxidase [Ilumatobacter sp.]